MKKAVLISNPLAGTRTRRRSRRVQEAVAVLHSAGIAVELRATSGPGDARQLAREAVKNGSDLVIVCGGDGTINEVLNGLVPSNIPLAVLPGGTANIVAKELGLPGNIVKAARQLPSWRPCRIPLGRATWEESGSIGQRFFVALAGVGFDARIISQLDMEKKLRMGVVAYCSEAVRQVFHYSFPNFQVSVDSSTVSATFAVIQRSRRYAGWLKLAIPHSIAEPDFSCCMFEGAGAARYFRYAVSILTQSHQRLPDVRFRSGSNVHCMSDQAGDPILFEVDGELAGRIPVTFDTVPNALTLMAPEQFLSSIA
ncbi:MAG TPA: diacylglycerol kinase family protein [Terriglobia bacterium]|nr:diacylglycerol kinase family protein [Terriglobia bacterium]